MLRDRWEELECDKPCPIHFTKDERETLMRQLRTQNAYRQTYLDMKEEFGLGESGYFDFRGDPIRGAEEFSRVERAVEERRKAYMSGATDQADGQFIRALTWPFRNTLEDHPRSLLKAVD